MTYDDNNVFAKILRGELPCHKVYETDRILAFMDVMPRGDGHVLVIPKSKARNLLDVSPDDLAELVKPSRSSGKAAKSALSADGVTIQQFNESAGGQVVFHIHFHVLPALRRRAAEAPYGSDGEARDFWRNSPRRSAPRCPPPEAARRGRHRAAAAMSRHQSAQSSDRVDRLVPFRIQAVAAGGRPWPASSACPPPSCGRARPVPPQNAGREAGRVGRAERGRLDHLRAHHRHVEDVGLELHQELVDHHAAVGAQLLDGDARVLGHRVQHLAGLEGGRLERRAGDVALVGDSG